MEKVLVSADALRQILEAINGPGYLMRELQAIRSLGNSPIDTLTKEYNAAVIEHNKAQGHGYMGEQDDA